MKRLFIFCATLAIAHAQQELQAPPFQTEEDRAALRLQAGELFDAISPITREAGKSAVWIWIEGKRQVAIGTVIGEGDRILTKWSDVSPYKDRQLQCVAADNKTHLATITGVYEDEDLAVLQLKNTRLKPIVWAIAAKPPLGSFLVAAGPGDTPLALGVVSVNERTLRTSDQAFVGILGASHDEGTGVAISEVLDPSPAAKAGLKKGDIILAIDDANVRGIIEFRSRLAQLKPGQTVKVLVSRAGEEHTAEVTLEAKAEESNPRLRQLQVMERMGGDLSGVRDGFPSVIQADLILNPEECGSPVLDLQGNAVGISIARAGRIRSYVIPASHINTLLQRPAVSPQLAKVRTPEKPPQLSRNRAVQPRLNREQSDNLRARLKEMKRFMRQLDEEMLQLDR